MLYCEILDLIFYFCLSFISCFIPAFEFLSPQLMNFLFESPKKKKMIILHVVFNKF